jgi:hypothetical protein
LVKPTTSMALEMALVGVASAFIGNALRKRRASVLYAIHAQTVCKMHCTCAERLMLRRGRRTKRCTQEPAPVHRALEQKLLEEGASPAAHRRVRQARLTKEQS